MYGGSFLLFILLVNVSEKCNRTSKTVGYFGISAYDTEIVNPVEKSKELVGHHFHEEFHIKNYARWMQRRYENAFGRLFPNSTWRYVRRYVTKNGKEIHNYTPELKQQWFGFVSSAPMKGDDEGIGRKLPCHRHMGCERN